MADTPTEPSDQTEAPVEEPTETAEAEAPAEEPAAVEPPQGESAEEPAKKDDTTDLDSLKERLGALEAALASKEGEIKALRDTAAKDAAIRDAGLPSKYSQFLHGDESTWGDQVKDLLELTAKTPARPRDPAVDAQVGSDSEDRETAILRMFGLAE